jgi:hypothetical protein
MPTGETKSNLGAMRNDNRAGAPMLPPALIHGQRCGLSTRRALA